MIVRVFTNSPGRVILIGNNPPYSSGLIIRVLAFVSISTVEYGPLLDHPLANHEQLIRLVDGDHDNRR